MKTIKENLIMQNKYVSVYNNDIIDFKGNKGTYFTTTSIYDPPKKSVCVLPLNDKGEVFLFKEYRYAIQDYINTLVLGGVEKHLSVLDNAKKELKEETSLFSDNFVEVDFITQLAPDESNNNIHFYIAKDCTSLEGNYNESTEDFIYEGWININELYKKIVTGKIRYNAASLILILYYYNEFNKKNTHMNKKEFIEQRLEEIFENNKNKKVLEIKDKIKKELISFNLKMKKEDLFNNIKHYKDILSENDFWKDKVGSLYKDVDYSIENLYEDIATLNY